MNPDLTPAQNRVIDFVRAHIVAHGYPPTRSEIGKAMGYNPNAAHQHLLAIQRKGFIHLDAGVARGIRLASMPTEQISLLDAMRNVGIPSRPVLSLKT